MTRSSRMPRPIVTVSSDDANSSKCSSKSTVRCTCYGCTWLAVRFAVEMSFGEIGLTVGAYHDRGSVRIPRLGEK